MKKSFLNSFTIFFVLSFFVFTFLNNFNFALAQGLGGQYQGRDGAIRGAVDPNGDVSGEIAVPIDDGKGKIKINFGNKSVKPATGAPATGQGSSASSNCNAVDGNNVATFGSIGCLINNFTTNVVQMLIALFGASALAVFLWGLVMFIQGGTDTPEKREKGQKFMLWGIVALFVMVSVWGIVRMLQGFAGINRNETNIILPTVCIRGDCNNTKSSTDTNPLGTAKPSSVPATKTSPSAPAPSTPVSTNKDQYGNTCSGTARKAANGDILSCQNGKSGDVCQTGTCASGFQCDTSSDPNGQYGKCVSN